MSSLPLVEPLGVLWSSVFGLLGAEDSAPERPIRFTSEALREAADQVLAAADRADLLEAIDLSIAEEWWWPTGQAGERPQAARAGKSPLRTVCETFEKELDLASLARTLGPDEARRCGEGWNAYRELARTVLRLDEARKQARTGASPTTTDEKTGALAALFYRTTLPLSTRRHLLAGLHSLVAAIAIARAEERGKVEPWLAHALVDVFSEAPIQALTGLKKVLAGDTAAFLDDVRAGEKLKALIERWKREAATQGGTAYFPFGAPEHAEG